MCLSLSCGRQTQPHTSSGRSLSLSLFRRQCLRAPLPLESGLCISGSESVNRQREGAEAAAAATATLMQKKKKKKKIILSLPFSHCLPLFLYQHFFSERDARAECLRRKRLRLLTAAGAGVGRGTARRRALSTPHTQSHTRTQAVRSEQRHTIYIPFVLRTVLATKLLLAGVTSSTTSTSCKLTANLRRSDGSETHTIMSFRR